MNQASRILSLRDHALAVWQAAVDAVHPSKLIPEAIANPSFGIQEAMSHAPRILVVGAGKASAAMGASLENALPNLVTRMEGIVNVPADTVRPLQGHSTACSQARQRQSANCRWRRRRWADSRLDCQRGPGRCRDRPLVGRRLGLAAGAGGGNQPRR